MIFSLTYSDELKYGSYTFPSASIIFGWCLNICFILPIPIGMFYACIHRSDSRNSLIQRSHVLIVPDINKRKVKKQNENGTGLIMSSSSSSPPIAYV
jgi:hypothetical protein